MVLWLQLLLNLLVKFWWILTLLNNSLVRLRLLISWRLLWALIASQLIVEAFLTQLLSQLVGLLLTRLRLLRVVWWAHCIRCTLLQGFIHDFIEISLGVDFLVVGLSGTNRAILVLPTLLGSVLLGTRHDIVVDLANLAAEIAIDRVIYSIKVVDVDYHVLVTRTHLLNELTVGLRLYSWSVVQIYSWIWSGLAQWVFVWARCYTNHAILGSPVIKEFNLWTTMALFVRGWVLGSHSVD